MRITIYFKNKPVYLCDELDVDLADMRGQPSVIYSEKTTSEGIKEFIRSIFTTDIQSGILVSPNFEKLKKDFFENFEYVEAAGGIVQNEKREILFIFRRGKWDLPKGKLDVGEDPETCARREIEEETGVKGLVFQYRIGSTFHVYEEGGKQILKESHWFFYRTNYSGKTLPQYEEDITEVTWTPTRRVSEPMSNTYGTIRSIMHTFFDKP